MAGRQVLAQLGAADIILSGQPDITFFLEQYKPQGLFATRVVNVQFEHEPTYGTDSFVTLPMNGDLVTAMYARFDISTPTGTAFFDSAGALMIERAELYIGNQLIERLWGEFITLVNEVEVPQGQQVGLTNLIGGTSLGATNTPLSRYVVPLKFKALARGLPVVPDMQFRIILNNFSDFCSDPNLTFPMTFNLLTEYVFLSESERDYIQKRGPTVYLTENVQRARYLVPAGTSNVRCMTNFLHPVKELFFTVQNQNATGFDYYLDSSNIAGPSYSNNFSNINQLNSMAIYFNEAQRLDPLIGTNLLLGTAQFIENHTRVPTRPFYMYSFSLDPQSNRPTGSVNFGRLKHQYFDLFLARQNPALAQNRVVTIWARYYQFLEVDGFKTMRVLFDNMDETGQTSFIP
jgi:hypothetical protein